MLKGPTFDRVILRRRGRCREDVIELIVHGRGLGAEVAKYLWIGTLSGGHSRSRNLHVFLVRLRSLRTRFNGKLFKFSEHDERKITFQEKWRSFEHNFTEWHASSSRKVLLLGINGKMYKPDNEEF